MAGKLKNEDLSKLNSAVDSTLSWLDMHQSASKEEFESKQKELEGTAMPIMSKLAQEAGGSGGFPGGGFPGGAGWIPWINGNTERLKDQVWMIMSEVFYPFLICTNISRLTYI